MSEHDAQPQPGPAVAVEVPVPEVPVPGVPAVAAALDRLRAIEGTPVAEHVEAFDGVHRLLQDALATLDEA